MEKEAQDTSESNLPMLEHGLEAFRDQDWTHAKWNGKIVVVPLEDDTYSIYVNGNDGSYRPLLSELTYEHAHDLVDLLNTQDEIKEARAALQEPQPDEGTFNMVVGANETRLDSAREAGAAFFHADITERPAVIHGMPAGPGTGPGGSARLMAEAVIHVQYEDGSKRYVKYLPYSDKEADKEFRVGYFEALDKSVNERLKAADWEAAKPAHPSAAPMLDQRLYEDLEELSKNDFEKAAKAWEQHAPQGTTGPTFVDREWKRQFDALHEIQSTARNGIAEPPSGGVPAHVKGVNLNKVITMEKEAQDAIKYIGERLPKPDWETARNLVSSADRKGFVYLAKPNAQYAGKVLMMSETHLVQQVGKNSAVAHDLSVLENGPELERQFDNGEIKAGRTNIKVEYGQDRGKADIVTYNQQRAETVQTQAEKWAEQNITNSKSRETFLKHVRTFAQDMAKGQEPAKTLPDKAKAPETTQTPQQQQRGR